MDNHHECINHIKIVGTDQAICEKCFASFSGCYKCRMERGVTKLLGFTEGECCSKCGNHYCSDCILDDDLNAKNINTASDDSEEEWKEDDDDDSDYVCNDCKK